MMKAVNIIIAKYRHCWLAIAMYTLLPLSATAQDRILNLYAWTGEIPEFAIHQFEKETGIKVNFSTFENNEIMYAKVKSDAQHSYDLILPSSYFVDRMRKQNMLAPMDKSKIPNYKYLDPTFLNAAYDPKSEYSIPHIWGVTGIFVNSQYYSSTSVSSWKALWNPRFYDKLMMIDDMREVFSMALLSLGYSSNDTNPAHIHEAYLKLKALMQNIKVFSSDTLISIMIDEDATAGMAWNGDAYKAYVENKNIKFILPKEGFVIWVDNFIVAKNSRHKDAAYAFINFMLRPDVAKEVALAISFPTANLAARKALPKEIRDNPIAYPPEEILKRGQFQVDLDPAAIAIYEKYWEELKLG